jgi:uncharacterized protein
MKNLIIGSVSAEAGKTSLIVGLAKALNKNFGYLKPFGDRLIYRKKRLWDYDAALVTNIFGLEHSSEEMTIGFEHAKLRYMYDESGTKDKLSEMVKNLGDNNPYLFIEGGKDFTYGTSVKLDTLSLVKYLKGKLILVVAGDEGTIIDDLTFVKKYIDTADIDYSVVINKVTNIEDYKENHLNEINEMGINVLGVLPYEQDLIHVPVSYIAERIQARVIAGEGGLNKRIKQTFVGSMSGDSASRHPIFQKENKLVITAGDRSDYLVAALDSNTSGIILTNNIIPPQSLISIASEKNIPMMLVPFDTFTTAKQVDDMTPLLTKDDNERIDLVSKIIKENINIKALA